MAEIHIPGVGAQKSKKRTRKRVLITVLVVLVVAAVAAAGTAGFYYWQKADTEQKAEKALQEKRDALLGRSSDMSMENQDKIRAEHEADYTDAKQAVYGSKPGQWTREMLDEAYEVLIYNDKTGGLREVNDMLAMMEFAEGEGLNLDDNSWGITKADRDAIRKRMLEREAAYEAAPVQPQEYKDE